MPASRPPVLAAPDAFKGTLRATEVAAAMARGLERSGWECDPCPVGDGGEGTMEVLLCALGGETAGATVHDPLGREIQAGFALIEDGATAIVESAQASGLTLIAPEERDPEAASTAGTGELILAAAGTGAAVVVLTVGGTATTDGAAGAIAVVEEAGGLGATALVVLCDVRTPWERAAEVFAPQKGADAETVTRLARRLDQEAARLPRDPRGMPLTGAGGGLAGGLWAAFGARLVAGAPFVLDALNFDVRARASRAVMTGEGRLDRSSLAGKAVGEIGTRCRQAGIPLHSIVGRNEMDPFDRRIIDLETIVEAGALADIEDAAAAIGAGL